MPMRTIPQAVAGSESRGGERSPSPHVSLPRRGRKGHVSTRVGRRRHGLWRDARDGEVGVSHLHRAVRSLRGVVGSERVRGTCRLTGVAMRLRAGRNETGGDRGKPQRSSSRPCTYTVPLKCGTCHVLVTLPGGRCWIGEGHRDAFADAGGRAYSRRTQGTSWHTPSERRRGSRRGLGGEGRGTAFPKGARPPRLLPKSS